MSFGENYLDVYLDVARSKIGQLCTNFTAYQFFNNQSDVGKLSISGLKTTSVTNPTRSVARCTELVSHNFYIASDILKGLQGLFASNLHSTVEYFQLHSVKLPAQFEDAIQGMHNYFRSRASIVQTYLSATMNLY